MYILTMLHIMVAIAFLLAYMKKKKPLYLHVGIGALGIGAGMLAIIMGLYFLG